MPGLIKHPMYPMINWTYYPEKSDGSFHRCETYRGKIDYDDMSILVAIIFLEDDKWFVSIEDTLTSDEFNQVHAKLQEILSAGTQPA